MAVAKKRPKKIYMPGDLGDARTRRKYRKSGPVITYMQAEAFNKMGETICLDEFLKLPDTRAKDVMLELSSISDQKLADEWKVQTSFVRKIRRILGIQKDHSGAIVANTDILCEKWPPTYRPRKRRTVEVQETMKIVDEDLESSDERTFTESSKGFSFSLEGVFTASEIEKRLEALAIMVACSIGSKYSIKISLDEIVDFEEVCKQDRDLDLHEINTL